jgi:hypothetical protein
MTVEKLIENTVSNKIIFSDIPEFKKAHFWNKYKIKGNCWEWQGTLSDCGYGRFRVNDQSHGAHRVSFALINQCDLSSNENVCHSCDNPKCINPQHLFISDHNGNMLDRHAKYRYHKKTKKSKYVGVFHRPENGKWRSIIKMNGKSKSLGNYVNEIDAAIAYDNAMIEQYGYDAVKNYLNVPNNFPPPKTEI